MLAVRVRLLHGRYEAGTLDPGVAEWPPHPARLHCALLAGAHTSAHARLLRWLEAQPPPQVWADPTPEWAGEHQGFVVTGKITAGGGNQTYPGRTSQARRRALTLPAHPEFVFCWPDLQASEIEVEVLAELTARVPYFGRSTCTAILTVHQDKGEMDSAELARFVPDDGTGVGRLVELRVAYPGYTDALDEIYAEGAPAWEAPFRTRTYLVAGVEDELVEDTRPVLGTGHVEMVMFSLPRGVYLDGLDSGRITGKLRHTVMSRIPDPVPAQVSGHGADDREHVAYLPLLDAGHRYARGHLLGVALGLPEMDPRERRSLLRAVANTADPLVLDLGDARLRLQLEGGARDRQALRLTKQWWQGPATRWASVTPIVLDRFCGKGKEEDEIARSCRRLGLPDPVEIIPGTAPMIRGGAALRRRHLPRQESRPRPFLHAVVEFPVPVRGPLLLGAQRFLGMGLFAPLPAAGGDRGE